MKAVFLPGMDGTGNLFDPLLRLWPSNEAKPIIVSYPLDRFLTYDELFNFIRPLMPVGESYVLIAESFGGPLAVRMAASHPPMLKGLVLSATFVKQPKGRFGLLLEKIIGPYLFRRAFFIIGRLVMRAQGLSASQIQLLLSAIGREWPAILAGRLKEIMKVDVVADLKRCPVPVLCLYGERDLFLTKRCHELIVESAPKVHAVGLDTPHFLLQAKPAEALEHILAFMKSVDPRA